MKVNVNGKTYYVRWMYDKYDRSSETTCHINLDTDKAVDGKWPEPQASGTALKSVHDHDNNNKGRMVSLKKALHKLFPSESSFGPVVDPHDLPSSEGFSKLKDIRTAFWEAYRNMTKTPRW